MYVYIHIEDVKLIDHCRCHICIFAETIHCPSFSLAEKPSQVNEKRWTSGRMGVDRGRKRE